MSRPLDSVARKQARLLQFRTAPADLGKVIAYRPDAPVMDLAVELAQEYKRTVGSGLDVQPPYRALECVLRAAAGTWARWQWNDGCYELLCAAPISTENRRDVFSYWAEAVVPGPPSCPSHRAPASARAAGGRANFPAGAWPRNSPP
ncbi:hypothetical protein [Streptomyces sp. CBMA156]|uniref:hypothetical protein n=1 Tax=Streptomyces sp. CBMA156 TaxID=1930280 RepID=UPI001661C5EF|nr:hypothetical protein [Streptomyces sp. CBMA156]MBD0670011.1 hypothetical protein [Streptomyces sp. CBMA156]